MNATESAERGEVDPAVARIAYNALASSCATHRTEIAQHAKWAHRWSCSCGERSVETDFGTASYEAHQHEDRMRTAAVLDALAGRLLPPVVQTREERGTRIGDGSIITLAEAGSRYTLSAQSLRVRIISTLADDGSPYGGATLTGKWRNVD